MPTIQNKPTTKRAARGSHLDQTRDRLTISRPDQLHALGNPMRWRILGRLLISPASVQQLARALGIAKGTVGHHVRVLESAGLIRVVEERRVRGVVEKRYARVARQFQLPESHTVPAESRREVGTMPLRQALAEARPATSQDDPSMSLVIRARMPAERARRFAAMIETLAAEFADGAPESGETFGLVAGIYVPDWAGPEQDEEED
jgi:DNA-binding transcriptional ArsR family regulator